MMTLETLLDRLPPRTGLLERIPGSTTAGWRAWYLLRCLQEHGDSILQRPAARLFGAIYVDGAPRWPIVTEGGAR